MKIFIIDRFGVSPDLISKLSANHELVRDLTQSDHVDMILLVSLGNEDLSGLSDVDLEGLDCVRLAHASLIENREVWGKIESYRKNP
ncbi:MAG: hypothetical protein O3B41_02505 [Bacteroidetes bacterium]|nr:hypothetical protein [Bacteroidota bacterium]